MSPPPVDTTSALSRQTYYYAVMISGFIVFSTSAKTMSQSSDMKATFAFGMVNSLIAGALVLANYFERTRRKLNDGPGTNLEAAIVILLLVWNIAAVCVMTRIGGPAYAALNLFYASWLGFGAAVLLANDFLFQYERRAKRGHESKAD